MYICFAHVLFSEAEFDADAFFPLTADPNCMRGVVPTDTCRGKL